MFFQDLGKATKIRVTGLSQSNKILIKQEVQGVTEPADSDVATSSLATVYQRKKKQKSSTLRFTGNLFPKSLHRQLFRLT